MSIRVWTGFAVATLCGVATLAAQKAAPEFEVVSIRELPAGAPPTMREATFTPFRPGGAFINSDTDLFSLIALAYSVRYPDYRLLGLPAWKAKRYAIAAKPSDDFTRLYPNDDEGQVRLMLRKMLADRFNLKLRTEIRRETVVRMAVDAGGLQLKEVAAPVPPETEGHVNIALSDRGGRIVATKATLAGLAKAAGLFLRQDVIDETGLNGYYDFDIRWSAPPAPNMPAASPTLGSDGIDLFMSTLKERLGLRFSRGTGPVHYWIVEHVDPPKTED